MPESNSGAMDEESFFTLVLIINAEDCTGEGENLSEGGEDGRVNNSQWRDKEGCENQYGSKRSHTDCQY